MHHVLYTRFLIELPEAKLISLSFISTVATIGREQMKSVWELVLVVKHDRFQAANTAVFSTLERFPEHMSTQHCISGISASKYTDLSSILEADRKMRPKNEHN